MLWLVTPLSEEVALSLSAYYWSNFKICEWNQQETLN